VAASEMEEIVMTLSWWCIVLKGRITVKIKIKPLNRETFLDRIYNGPYDKTVNKEQFFPSKRYTKLYLNIVCLEFFFSTTNFLEVPWKAVEILGLDNNVSYG